MSVGFLPVRIVHLHLTRRCNLACRHCYSTSSPWESDAVDLEVLIPALERLRLEGYEILSLSGGEPFLDSRLGEIVEAAHGLGYKIHLVTNGMLVNRRRLAGIAEKISVAAVSLDGRPELHNEIRGRDDAFRGALRGLDVLLDHGVSTGLAFCVSRRSLPDVPWAFDLACRRGARLFHLHPLVASGRAVDGCEDLFLSQNDAMRLYLVAALLESETTRSQLDLVRSDEILQARERLERAARSPRMADLINPLVLTETGKLMPFAYGFDSAYSFGDLARIDRALETYDRVARPRLAALLGRALDELEERPPFYLEWYEHLLRVAELSRSREIAGDKSLRKLKPAAGMRPEVRQAVAG